MLEEIQTYAVNLQQLKNAGGDLNAVPQESRRMHKPTPTPPPAANTAPKEPLRDTQRLPRRLRAKLRGINWLYPAMGLAVFVAVAGLFLAVRSRQPADRSDDTFPLSAQSDGRTYGGGRVDVPTPRHAQFAFEWAGGMAQLSVAPGSIDQDGEVTILVNGIPFASLPVTGPRWGRAFEAKLDRHLLHPGRNAISFQPAPSSDGRWGIREVLVSQEALPPPSLDKARELMRIADEAMAHKKIDPKNLAMAEDAYHRAVLFMEQLEPQPHEYAVATAAYKAARTELDVLVQNQMFAADQAAHYGKTAEAESILRELLLYVPFESDPRRADVLSRLAALRGK
jgi:hypothetical protein